MTAITSQDFYTAWVSDKKNEFEEIIQQLSVPFLKNIFQHLNELRLVEIINLMKTGGRRQLRDKVIIKRCTWKTDLKLSQNENWIFSRCNLLGGNTSADQARLTAFGDLPHRVLDEIQVGDIIWLEKFVCIPLRLFNI